MKIIDFQIFNGIDTNIVMLFLGIFIYFIRKYENHLLVNILITAFVLSLFDLYLKKIFLFDQKDDYYIFIMNNIITILCVNLLIYIIKGMFDKITIERFSYLAFSCFFYEMIVFKLYNYNNLCNHKLRVMTKTIMRIATTYILTAYLMDEKFDEKWFNYSMAQLLNFSLYNLIFE